MANYDKWEIFTDLNMEGLRVSATAEVRDVLNATNAGEHFVVLCYQAIPSFRMLGFDL
jgi:hypothetical protein